MDLLIAFVVFLLSMVVCLTTGVSMLIALAIGMVCFSAVALKRGFPLEDVLRMILSSTRRSFIVLRVLLLIGLVTALWRTSGTIAFFVYYGVQLITPHFFVLIAFVLSAVLSYALGTSFGVAGTAGVIFMTLARSGGVNELVTAGDGPARRSGDLRSLFWRPVCPVLLLRQSGGRRHGNQAV